MDREKKCINLSEMNDKFSEEVLTSILSKKFDGKEVQLTDWVFEEGSAKGDNYLSNVYKGKVNGVIDDDLKQHVQMNIVVKSMPKNSGTRKTFRIADFFRNEILFYTEIASRFERFLAEKGQADLLSIPRYVTSFMDGENDFLILENASCLGFNSASQQNCLNWSECVAILKTLAKFHAISFAYKDQRKEEFAKITNFLKETFFDYWDWYKNYHEKTQILVKHALATEYPDSKASKQYSSYKHGDLFNKCAELCKRKDAPTSVVTEGDCWAPNFLIRELEHGQKEALILDFQLARCASPVLDLSFLIYSCTLKSFRDRYFDDALKFYHDELCDTIELLGSDSKKIYPWDLFMKEIKEQFVFGVCTSLEAVPLNYIEMSSTTELNNIIKNDEIIDIGDLMTLSSISVASGRQRVADIVIHAVEKGYM